MTTSYVTQATEWPSAVTVPEDVQKLIALFYETADSTDPGAGQVLAEQVFSKNATLASASGAFHGFDEIARSRDNAWRAVKSRKHTIQQVYVRDCACRELMLLGLLHMACLNGAILQVPFCARVVVDDSTTVHNRRLNYMEVYADNTPVADALKR